MNRRHFLSSSAAVAVLPSAINGFNQVGASSSTTSEEDPFITYSVENIEVNVLPGSEWVGEHTLRCALWGESLTNEYRPYDHSGDVRIYVYPPAPNGRSPGGAVALASPGDADLFFHHPPEKELTPLDELDDPRDSSWFRVIMHEYIHAETQTIRGELDQQHGARAGWFEHGFTEYTTKNHQVNYYREVFEAVEEGNVPTLSQAVGNSEYSFGLFIMKYLISEYGIDTVNEIYWDPDEDTAKSVENVLGMPIEEFESAWQETLSDWVEETGDIPEEFETDNVIQPDGWIQREPDPDIQTKFPELDELVTEAVENPDSDSEFDAMRSYTVDNTEVYFAPGYEWVGEHTLRCALWGESLTTEYRPYDHSGDVRVHVYPPAKNGRAPASAVAMTSPGDADLFFTHPPKEELTPLEELNDPRDSSWFRVIMHEYIHAESHTIRGEVDGGYAIPAGWFEHGFTEYTTKEHHVNYYHTVFEAVQEGDLPNLSQVESGPQYAFGLFILKYLTSEYGIDTVNEIYWDSSEDTETAVENVLGISIEEFELEWQEALKTWVDEAGDVPEEFATEMTVQPDGWIQREPNPDIQTQFPDLDDLIAEAVEYGEATSTDDDDVDDSDDTSADDDIEDSDDTSADDDIEDSDDTSADDDIEDSDDTVEHSDDYTHDDSVDDTIEHSDNEYYLEGSDGEDARNESNLEDGNENAIPGFGIVGAVAGIAGAGYMIKRQLEDQEGGN